MGSQWARAVLSQHLRVGLNPKASLVLLIINYPYEKWLFHWEYTHNNWEYTHNNWEYTHNNWEYTHNNWEYTHNNWEYTHNNWEYTLFSDKPIWRLLNGPFSRQKKGGP